MAVALNPVLDQIAQRLARLGYFGPPPADPTVAMAPPEISERELIAALARLMDLHGIPAGTDGPTILRILDQPRCGAPDFARGPDAAGMCQWPPGHVVRVRWSLSLLGMSSNVIDTAFRNALKSWENVCGIRFDPAMALAHEANIDARSGPIDGAGNILAWSYLPCGATAGTTLAQLYDSRDQWTVFGATMLEAVICHEVGHALGLDHLPQGNLLAPTVSARISTPQAGDIAQVVGRYGRAVPIPEPEPDPEPPTPLPPSGDSIVLRPGDSLRLEVIRG